VVEVRYAPGGDTRARLRTFLERYAAEVPANAQQHFTLLRLAH